MSPFTKVVGEAAPIVIDNIDTDVIIRIERLTEADQSRLGDYAFEMLRYREDGTEDESFALNRPRFRHAPILIAGRNFGCGSSREGAVTALVMLGIKAILAPSFGDIFYGNCFQNGVLPVALPQPEIQRLAAEATECPWPTTVDLQSQVVQSAKGRVVPFEIDGFRRDALLAGLDDIGQTVTLLPEILQWQEWDRARRPWLWIDNPERLSAGGGD